MVSRRGLAQPVQSKWGNVARAVGNGIMQLGELNYREKLERERTANLERIRLANRADKAADTKASQEFQANRDQTQRDFSIEENNKNRTHKVESEDKAIKSREGIAASNNETRLKLASGGNGSGKPNSKIQLIEYYKKELNLSSEDAVAKTNQLNGKSPKAMYQQFLSDILSAGMLEGDEAKTQARSMAESVDSFNTGNSYTPAPTQDNTSTGSRISGEPYSDYMDRILNKGGN